jgi:hypothetical protein
VRAGRRREFESFGWGEAVPDPQSEETFRRSMLDRSRAAEPEHAAIFALYRDLLTLREEEPMLRPDGADLSLEERDGCITLLRRARGSRENSRHALLAIFNCTAESRAVALPEGRWLLRLTTDARGYGGEGRLVEDVSREPVAVAAGEKAWNKSESLGGNVQLSDAPRRLLMKAEADTKMSVTIPPWTAVLYIRQ